MTKKPLTDYKLGEICNEDLLNGVAKAPLKVVAVAITFQNKGVQFEIKVKTDDFREDEGTKIEEYDGDEE